MSAFTEDGFYRTGDKGRIDPDTGRLQILGRIREQINRLGEKIMPSELEEYLLDHPQSSRYVLFRRMMRSWDGEFASVFRKLFPGSG
ncbi:MAG: hypothetical protein V8R50_02455 [Clostridia bacterium]